MDLDNIIEDQIDQYIFEQSSYKDIKELFDDIDNDAEELTKLFNTALKSGLPSDHLKALEFGDDMADYYRPYLEEFKKKNLDDIDFDDLIRLNREFKAIKNHNRTIRDSI